MFVFYNYLYDKCLDSIWYKIIFLIAYEIKITHSKLSQFTYIKLWG